MNAKIRLKKNSSASEIFNSTTPASMKGKGKLKLKKSSLSKILKDIQYFKYKKIDNNNIGKYNPNDKFRVIRNKPKTAAIKNYRYYYKENAIYDNDSNFTKNTINKNKMKLNNNKPVWNYSYYYDEKKNNNDKCFRLLKQNKSYKKLRIKNLLEYKNPYTVDEWQKPRMIRILERNSLIKEEIMLKPWLFFSNIDNY